MECKITSIKLRRCAAFTLVEFVIASAIGLLVLAAVASLIAYSAQSFATTANYVDMDQKSRLAIDRVTTQLRQMDVLTSISSNSASFRRGNTNYSLVYDPANRTLSQVEGATTTVLLTECDSCSFSIFQRNTISNSFDQFPTSVSSNTCKLVQVNWACSRTLFGLKRNTETEQSAKIVIRREK